MKYFNALNEVENEVIRLGELKNLLAVVVNGIECSSSEEIISSIHYIEENIRDISDNLSDKFQILFDAVRDDK